MTKAEQNEFTRQAVKEQVLSNPAYAGTRKLILILMCIPSAFFVADRILALVLGGLSGGNGFGWIWGIFIMAMIVVTAINAQTVTAAVFLFITAVFNIGTVLYYTLSYSWSALNGGILIFELLWAAAAVAVGIVLLANGRIRAYHAHYKAVLTGAQNEAKQTGAAGDKFNS